MIPRMTTTEKDYSLRLESFLAASAPSPRRPFLPFPSLPDLPFLPAQLCHNCLGSPIFQRCLSCYVAAVCTVLTRFLFAFLAPPYTLLVLQSLILAQAFPITFITRFHFAFVVDVVQ